MADVSGPGHILPTEMCKIDKRGALQSLVVVFELSKDEWTGAVLASDVIQKMTDID